MKQQFSVKNLRATKFCTSLVSKKQISFTNLTIKTTEKRGPQKICITPLIVELLMNCIKNVSVLKLIIKNTAVKVIS